MRTYCIGLLLMHLEIYFRYPVMMGMMMKSYNWKITKEFLKLY